MKKVGLLIAGGIAAMVLLRNIGPMIGLAISLAILYLLMKQFLKAETKGAKVGIAIVGFFILMAAIHNVPAIIGVVAAAVLYIVFKKWNENKYTRTKSDNDDPFVNFEKQWNELKHN